MSIETDIAKDSTSEALAENKGSHEPKEEKEAGAIDHRPQETMEISWYHRLLIRVLKTGKMPKSIGIIMDGNRRYATKLNKAKHQGHSDGLKNLENTVFWCKELGI